MTQSIGIHVYPYSFNAEERSYDNTYKQNKLLLCKASKMVVCFQSCIILFLFYFYFFGQRACFCYMYVHYYSIPRYTCSRPFCYTHTGGHYCMMNHFNSSDQCNYHYFTVVTIIHDTKNLFFFL